MVNQEYPDLPFVPPRAYGTGRDGNSVQYIVVHYTAGSEGSSSAENGAAYDQRRTDGTSTHYFVDSDSVVQCVYTWNRANAAFSIGNRKGIQYELCGTAQSRAQWLDPVSDATITNAARQMARDCQKYGLPVRWLTPAQMNAGWKGICGHADVTLAYGLGDHMDPGEAFPRDVLLARIQQFLAPGQGTPPSARRQSMSTLYHNMNASPTVWALAGDSPGTPANWLETKDQSVANGLAAAHGNSIGLYQASFDDFKAKYLSPVTTTPASPPPAQP